ncbi:MAG: hypothetical protein MUE85_14820 [Microscillaceae bacterium]|jgi:hypothetical protein|nr:hypothetical protein [Microscillaceae bacterium]
MKILKILCLVILLTHCGKNQNNSSEKTQNNPHAIKQANFKTRPDTEIYFKNVRQLYYDREEQTNTKLNLYRFAQRSKTDQKPAINLVIVHNWRYNEAYLLVETNNFFPKTPPFKLFWRNKNGRDGTIFFENGDKTAHFAFANALYQGVLDEYVFYQSVRGQEVTILNSRVEREAIRITMLDYLKLTGKM